MNPPRRNPGLTRTTPHPLRACTALAASAVLLLTACGEGGGGGTSLRWVTSDVGSYGYRVSSFIADFLNRDLPEGTIVTVHPYPDTTADMKAVMDGEADIAYTADVGMLDFVNGGDAWQGYEPGVGELVHTFYAYPMESFVVTDTANAADLSSWADLDGEPGFYTPAGYMNWLNYQRVFDTLGYEFNHVEIDSSAVADSLQGGSIVSAGAYTTAGSSLPTYWQEGELTIDLAPVQLSDAEVETIEAAGLEVVTVDPSNAFTQDLGTDAIRAVPILFGFNVRADMDEELVLAILESLEGRVEELVRLDPGFTPLADDFVGTQTGAISAVPDVPVHPGLAAFLRERGAWDDSWTIAETP
ncbi:TAXI family TRAP transporter solute-binding subunit [Nocardiopsis protaetiae]|uniref:TAXI family TRAP transporter solute-binding subunit n=1 Tax=Nocardiopsis protaetiae TaxID=3382270 RepID=UPI00387AF490